MKHSKEECEGSKEEGSKEECEKQEQLVLSYQSKDNSLKTQTKINSLKTQTKINSLKTRLELNISKLNEANSKAPDALAKSEQLLAAKSTEQLVTVAINILSAFGTKEDLNSIQLRNTKDAGPKMVLFV